MRHKRSGWALFNFRWLKFKCARPNDGNVQRFIDAAALFQVNRRRFVDSLTCVYYHIYMVFFSSLVRSAFFHMRRENILTRRISVGDKAICWIVKSLFDFSCLVGNFVSFSESKITQVGHFS